MTDSIFSLIFPLHGLDQNVSNESNNPSSQYFGKKMLFIGEDSMYIKQDTFEQIHFKMVMTSNQST